MFSDSKYSISGRREYFSATSFGTANMLTVLVMGFFSSLSFTLVMLNSKSPLSKHVSGTRNVPLVLPAAMGLDRFTFLL